MMDKIYKTMQKYYKDTQKCYAKYVLLRSEVCDNNDIKTQVEAIRFLDDIDIEGDYENCMRESWYLSWYLQALEQIQFYMNSKK